MRQAARLVETALEQSPNDEAALLIAAEIAERRDRPAEALAYLRRLPEDDPDLASLFDEAGRKARDLGRAGDAEFFYKRTLRLDPNRVEAHRGLAMLYVAEGRRWESAPHLWELIRRRRFTLLELGLLGNLDELYESTEIIEFCRQAVPEDPVPLIGLARLAMHRSQFEEAERLLREVISYDPKQIEAQANLGKILADQGRDEEFRKWHAELPASADDHPGIWTARATFALHHGEEAAAIHCYSQLLLLNPNDRAANYQLSHLLASQGEDTLAELFARRSKRLDRLINVIRPVLSDGPTPEQLRTAAQVAEELGRLWEAWAWYYAVTNQFPGEEWAQEEVVRLEEQLTPNTPRTLGEANPAPKVDLSRFPRPSWNSGLSPEIAATGSDNTTTTDIRFVDSASAVGIDFTYDNGTVASEGLQIFQTVGGGVAVIDFDGDGWPDVYFPQAGPWPVQPRDSSAYTNQLYRNMGDGRFREITDFAAVSDPGFGLGATVGDFNSDGWPDIYTANIGRNRLYLNNGDGTFSDATEEAGITGDEWTSSALMADLNGDGFPDLYDVNYCAGQEPFERICLNKKLGGVRRSCKPTGFPAEPDRLFISRGNGTVEDVTEQAGIVDADGRGLGIVAFDPDGSGRLNLFVANDMTANLYFVNSTVNRSGVPAFEEHAAVTGLAFDLLGQPQACMGVAADDADGDGLIDLFVTNFHNESNTLYRQRSQGFFADATREAGLRDPSFKMLGFGTQFLDADLDGWPDLVVANGHIDDYSKLGTPYRMRPQFFRNRKGRFQELSASRLGRYFKQEQLSRGLARLDWNRDGLEDFTVSHLYEPAALVTNQSTAHGHGITLRLVGTHGNRDAIGTTVTISSGGRTRTRQLTAGDGYQSSNERKLVFGLGNNTAVDSIEVRWLSGERQVFRNVPADAEYLAVEGRETLTGIGHSPKLATAGKTPDLYR